MVNGLSVTLTEGFGYDAVGNRVSQTDFAGRTHTFEYDARNRLLWKRLPDGRSVGYTYTATGQVASITDSRGLTLHAYDSRDRLTKVTNPDGSVLEYGYDGVGNRTSLKITVAGISRTTTYGFDALNRLEKLTDPEGQETTWTYDPAGNRKTQVLPNGITTTYGYDGRNRLTSIEHKKADGALLASYVYTLSPTGQRTQVAETTASGIRTVEYGYDTIYRLVSEKVTVGATSSTTSYTYDDTGNRLTKAASDGTTSYAYDANDRMNVQSGTALTFDANGNALQRKNPDGTISTLEYDVENRLTKVTLPGAQGTVEYAYDGEGHRVETKVTKAGVTTVTKHLVDKNRPYAEVVEERDGTGALVATYAHGHDLEGPVKMNALGSGGGVRYFLTDALGSTRFLTDTAATTTDSYLYEAYGTVTARTGATPNPHQFTGEQFDENAQLTYLRTRWMDARMGRFLTVDPHAGEMRNPTSLHDYLYGNANSVNMTDPTGNLSVAFVGFSGSMITSAIKAFALVCTAEFAARSVSGAASGGPSVGCKPKSGLHRGRIQAQGGGYEDSESWARPNPLTAREGLQMLENLVKRMPRREFRAREFAIENAELWITRVSLVGGVKTPPLVSRSWSNAGKFDERIDIEVRDGWAFIP